MNILVFGDIFGRPGREIVKKILPEWKEKYKVDFTIANAENLSHGKGFTEETILELNKAGVDFFTSGNHTWKQKGVIPKLDDKKFPVIRPANYPEGEVPGRGWQIVEGNLMKRVLIINIMGQVFMPMQLDSPFRSVAKILDHTKAEHLHALMVDFHADATSEKAALGHFLDGKVSLVYGTHTHVPTHDARILPGGTAFITDVGMSGPIDSVIGIEKKGAIKHFLTQLPSTHEVAEGPSVANAIVVTIDEKTRLATNITQLQLRETG